MKILLLIWLGKIIALASRILSFGIGSTWPGHVAFELEPRILSSLINQLRKGVILIAGTNGKTTTAKMIGEILGSLGTSGNLGIVRNESGANLLNGMVSALIQKSNWLGKINADWAVFEVDEATLPLALAEFTPKIVVLLNLFRDQLDRYGEVDLIADKWLRALKGLEKETIVILNADDPHIAYLGKNLTAKVLYFGLEDEKIFLEKMQHATDSTYCPSCGQRLSYRGIYYSHLGLWQCLNCGLKRPKPDLSNWSNWSNLKGVYNRYNTLAAVLVVKTLGVAEDKIKRSLKDFKPAFGRQEEFSLAGKTVKILLSKNPAGFNESLRTLAEFPEKKKIVLLVLNDRIPDGRDVSWIWDVDFEMIPMDYQLIISGDRAYYMALRIKYTDKFSNSNFQFSMKISNFKFQIEKDLKRAINSGLENIRQKESLYILPTYSAMLEVRKILRGRKLL